MMLHLFPKEWSFYMLLQHFPDYFVLHDVKHFSDNLANLHVATHNSTILAKIHADTPIIVIPFCYFTSNFTHFSHFCHFSMLILN
jgi:hypothetical protein